MIANAQQGTTGCYGPLTQLTACHEYPNKASAVAWTMQQLYLQQYPVVLVNATDAHPTKTTILPFCMHVLGMTAVLLHKLERARAYRPNQQLIGNHAGHQRPISQGQLPARHP